MRSKATLKQIAKELGVSVSTVSKALNGSPEISEPTKQRVQEYAKLKNYKPNVIGLNLKNRRTKTIGVIIPNILNSFFAKVFSGIEKVADEKGYKVITCISNESSEKEINALEMLSNGTIDGFILSIAEESQKLQKFDHFTTIINEGTPIVMFDRIADEVNCDKVIVDDFESAVNATEHLIKTGCKKIALLSAIDNLSVGKLRAQGFYKAMGDNGLKVDENLVILTNNNDEFNSIIGDFFVKNKLDNFLHKNPETADALLRKILQAERERKELSGIQKLARERAKKATLHNRKLRDCKIHYNDLKNERRLETTLFITEGDSASGSITASRDVLTQAVFSLKGKPLNCYGLTKKVVYENEEFNLLQAALNIEDGLEDLRYNNVVVATDADVDGMHIRLLLITFFLQFFPELVQEGHLYILQTPLFRVRNKQKTTYCYSDEERRAAIAALGPRPEITRFKGLGEISPGEFKHFIGGDIRLEPVMLGKEQIDTLLEYYMGKNTPERQEFIIENLRVELDEAAE